MIFATIYLIESEKVSNRKWLKCGFDGFLATAWSFSVNFGNNMLKNGITLSCKVENVLIIATDRHELQKSTVWLKWRKYLSLHTHSLQRRVSPKCWTNLTTNLRLVALVLHLSPWDQSKSYYFNTIGYAWTYRGMLLRFWSRITKIFSTAQAAYVCTTALSLNKCLTNCGSVDTTRSLGNTDLNVIIYLIASAFSTGNSSTVKY